ncbi:MAG TPA: hypothetical protein VH255_07760 [Verrucomicrobiae bacterium]|jgi:hypothetical protein|nr:hypothetical protein [Verrucomicrobiae bacterium]
MKTNSFSFLPQFRDWNMTTGNQRTGGSLESGRLCVVLTTIFINIIVVALLRFVPWSDWKTGLALNFLDNFLLLGFVIRNRDKLLLRLMLFGFAVGVAELAADAWLVDFTHTLDYSVGGGPMLWRSPAWMPLAWEIVALQFGYLGIRLTERFGTWVGLLIIGILGATNIPYYEEMAKYTHWWQYSGCRMISNTPYYIILGEFGIAICLTLLAKRLRSQACRSALLPGLLGGLTIFLCYALAYLITDGLHRAPSILNTMSH